MRHRLKLLLEKAPRRQAADDAAGDADEASGRRRGTDNDQRRARKDIFRTVLIFAVFAAFAFLGLRRDFVDGLGRLGEAQGDQGLDDGPRGIDLGEAAAEAELGTPGISM